MGHRRVGSPRAGRHDGYPGTQPAPDAERQSPDLRVPHGSRPRDRAVHRSQVTMLTSILLIPFLAALLMVVIPRNYRFVVRIIAIVATFATLVLACQLFAGFGSAPAGEGGYKYVQRVPWIPALGIQYL